MEIVRVAALLLVGLPPGLLSPSLLPFLRWCVIGKQAEDKCWKLAYFLQRASVMELVCVQAPHVFACMSLVHQNLTDVVNLDAEQLYVAGKHFEMKPLLFEQIGVSRFFTEDAIAVIRKSIDPHNGLWGLPGHKLCLTGTTPDNLQYQAVLNVLMPLGYMNVFRHHCSSAIPSVAAHFGPSCVPGAWSLDPDKRNRFLTLCLGCQRVCTEQDFYASPEGALRCLKAGGEVAFTSSSALANSSLNRDVFELLCIQGTRKPIGGNGTCPWIGRRSNSLAILQSTPKDRQKAWKAILVKAYKELTKQPKSEQLLPGVLFSENSFTALQDPYYHDTYERFLGLVFVRSMETPFPPSECGRPPTLRWCVILRRQMKKCREMVVAFQSRRLKPILSCVKAHTEAECVRWIAFGQADITLVKPETAVDTNRKHKLVPVAMEHAADGEQATGYLVAVIHKNRNLTLDQLIGAQSCHTGSDDVLGWQAALVLVERRLQLSGTACEFAQMATELFWQSCVPGMDQKLEEHKNLCGLCPDDCGINGGYYGAEGAIRCLRQVGGGDVTFITNHSLPKLQPHSAQFQLLCSDGTHRPLSDYATCHWLRIPPKVAVVSATHLGATERRKVTELLLQAQRYFGNASQLARHRGESGHFSIFATTNDRNSIFSAETSYLRPIWPETPIPETLGDNFVHVYERILQCSRAPTTHTPSILIFHLCLATCILRLLSSLSDW